MFAAVLDAVVPGLRTAYDAPHPKLLMVFMCGWTERNNALSLCLTLLTLSTQALRVLAEAEGGVRCRLHIHNTRLLFPLSDSCLLAAWYGFVETLLTHC